MNLSVYYTGTVHRNDILAQVFQKYLLRPCEVTSVTSHVMVTIPASVYSSFILLMRYTFWKLKFLKRSCDSLPDCLTSLIKHQLDYFVYRTDTVQVVSILPKQNTRQPLAKASQAFSHCNLLETEMALHNDSPKGINNLRGVLDK